MVLLLLQQVSFLRLLVFPAVAVEQFLFRREGRLVLLAIGGDH